jgi:DNA-binding MarR family transcriptional regulator
MEPTTASASAIASDRELASRFAAVLRHIWCTQGSDDIRAIEASGLSVVQVKVLYSLGGSGDDDPRPLTEIAERLGISPPSTSRAVDALVRGGYADRVEDASDRRVRRVSLTVAGERLLDELTMARVAGLERFVAALGRGERRKLASALDALYARPEIGSGREAA